MRVGTYIARCSDVSSRPASTISGADLVLRWVGGRGRSASGRWAVWGVWAGSRPFEPRRRVPLSAVLVEGVRLLLARDWVTENVLGQVVGARVVARELRAQGWGRGWAEAAGRSCSELTCWPRTSGCRRVGLRVRVGVRVTSFERMPQSILLLPSRPGSRIWKGGLYTSHRSDESGMCLPLGSGKPACKGQGWGSGYG